jgi:hypothetical protein
MTRDLAYPTGGWLSNQELHVCRLLTFPIFIFLSFRTTLVAHERIHGRRATIRDSCNAPIAANVPACAVLADASHRDGLAVAATSANQLQMARRDAERRRIEALFSK